MTWHKHITRDSTSNSSKSFSLLSRTHKNIQPAYYILYMQTHIIFFIAIVCAYSWFCWWFVFFLNNVQSTSLLKKAKAVQKKKKPALFVLHTKTHRVTAFFIQENKNSELPCHFLDFTKQTQTESAICMSVLLIDTALRETSLPLWKKSQWNKVKLSWQKSQN